MVSAAPTDFDLQDLCCHCEGLKDPRHKRPQALYSEQPAKPALSES